MACLAYYLTHYRNAKHFKTLSLSKLNTEAAQRKFANPSQVAANAIKANLIVPAPQKGFRQLSAMGEQYVEALPDHEQARAVQRKFRPKRSRTPKRNKSQPRAKANKIGPTPQS